MTPEDWKKVEEEILRLDPERERIFLTEDGVV